MALLVKHTKVTATPDGTDPTQIQPSDWNADHALTGFGGAAQLNVGTTTGTVAAGDDARITGAAQKSANLSDLANPLTARSNIQAQPVSTKLTGFAGMGNTLGFVVQVAVDSFAARSLAAGSGITITNPSGAATDPSIAVNQAFSPVWTGTHTFGSGAGAAAVSINGGAGSQRSLYYQTNGVVRWALRANTIAEGGSDSGSNFDLDAYNDAGAFLGNVFDVVRSSRIVTFAVGINAPAGGMLYASTDILARANTWTGAQTFSTASGNTDVAIRAAAGQARNILFQSATSNRWVIQVTSTAESGGNIGSDFAIYNYSDAGGFLGSVFAISRSTGIVTVSAGISAPAGGMLYAGTDILARPNVWTAPQTIEGAVGGQFVGRSTNNPGVTDQVNAWFQGSGYTSTGVLKTFGSMLVRASSVVNGAENNYFLFRHLRAGASMDSLSIQSGIVVGNPSGGDMGFGNVNMAGSLYYNGVDLFARPQTWSNVNAWAMNSGSIVDWRFSNTGAGGCSVGINGLAASSRMLDYRTNGALRWRVQCENTAESGGNAGSNFLIQNYDDAGAFLATQLQIARTGGVLVGNPAGGSKGNGTLNAQAVYDDNVLLTCYVLEAANNNGEIDLPRWDRLGLGGKHVPARKFSERIDELDPAKYAAKWQEFGVLPGMPSPEEWYSSGAWSVGRLSQKLWETVELHAVHVAKLEARIAELEKAA